MLLAKRWGFVVSELSFMICFNSVICFYLALYWLSKKQYLSKSLHETTNRHLFAICTCQRDKILATRQRIVTFLPPASGREAPSSRLRQRIVTFLPSALSRETRSRLLDHKMRCCCLIALFRWRIENTLLFCESQCLWQDHHWRTDIVRHYEFLFETMYPKHLLLMKTLIRKSNDPMVFRL